MQSALTLRGVHKAFKRKMVLDGVDLDIPVGSVVGLLGRNGSGKTTLIKCALGLLRCDAGEARVFGEDAWDLSPQVKERIGYVAQETHLYPWMRAKDMIAYTASFYPRWNHALADQLVATWEIDPASRPATMSVGQRQRLAIVLALGHEPDLLILDEPAASLDPGARRSFLKAILDIAIDGQRSVLFSTHITSDVERVADRVAILRNGRIVFEDELDTIKDQVKRIHITAQRALPLTMNMPHTLHEQVDGVAATVTASRLTPTRLAEIERDYGATVTVENLNLEDIFLELDNV